MEQVAFGSLSALSIGYRTYKCAWGGLKPSPCRCFSLKDVFSYAGCKRHVAIKDILLEQSKKAEGGGDRRIVLAREGGRERGRRWEAEIIGG